MPWRPVSLTAAGVVGVLLMLLCSFSFEFYWGYERGAPPRGVATPLRREIRFTWVGTMTRTPKSRKRWQAVGGYVVLGALAGVVVFGEIGADQAAWGWASRCSYWFGRCSFWRLTPRPSQGSNRSPPSTTTRQASVVTDRMIQVKSAASDR